MAITKRKDLMNKTAKIVYVGQSYMVLEIGEQRIDVGGYIDDYSFDDAAAFLYYKTRPKKNWVSPEEQEYI